MNRRTALLSTLSLTLMPKAALARPPFRLKGDPVPLLSPPFEDGAGRSLKLADFVGRVVLLNIWATWCPPCREEMPALDALQRAFGGPNFAVVPLSIDRDGLDAARRFYDEIGIRDLGLYWCEDLRVQLAFAAFGLPTTLLMDRMGRELARIYGPARWDKPAAITQITKVIDAGGDGTV